jgi:hypothetical protein
MSGGISCCSGFLGKYGDWIELSGLLDKCYYLFTCKVCYWCYVLWEEILPFSIVR